MKKFLILFVFLLISKPCQAERIQLKNSDTFDAKIVERSQDFIKVLKAGFEIKYWLSEIDSIDDNPVSPHTLDIRTMLEARLYPKDSWKVIEAEFEILFEKLNSILRIEMAEEAKKKPQDLRDFVAAISLALNQIGYTDHLNPPQLLSLLVNSFADENIENIIDKSLLSEKEKEDKKQEYFACSAVSQLGEIVFDAIGIEARATGSPRHVFLTIETGKDIVIFVDMINSICRIVDLNEWYIKKEDLWILKNEHRLSSDELLKIRREWEEGAIPSDLKKIVNYYSFINPYSSNYATAAILYNRGRAYYDISDFVNALKNFNRAIEINPNFFEAFTNRGLVYHDMEDFDKAIENYAQAIRINPNYEIAYCNRGMIYQDRKEDDRALSDYNRALTINPNYTDAYNGRGIIYAKRQEYNKALDDFNKIITINPGDSEAYTNRGIIYKEIGELGLAIKDHNQAIKINPNAAEAYVNRAVVYYMQGKYDKAWSDVHSTQKLNHEVPETLLDSLSQTTAK